MNRRGFLKAALAGATLATGWQSAALASGFGPKASEPEFEDKAKVGLVALKGICTNDENPDRVNCLNPNWMYIEFGDWCWNMAHQYNCKWSLHLFDQIPNAADVAQAIQHPSYEGWWLMLNEPDLANVSAEAAVQLVQQQMSVVLAVDPNAKFCLGGGSQMHAPNTSTPWFPAVWQLLPAEFKAHVNAVHTHYYPQTERGATHESAFTADPIRKYVKGWRNWLNKNAGDMHRELWVTEIGLNWRDTALQTEPRLPLYPLLIQEAMNGIVERWAWYSQSKPDGFVTLLEPEASQLTPVGTVFAASQPGIYPVKAKVNG